MWTIEGSAGVDGATRRVGVEVWRVGGNQPGRAAQLAEQAEADGFDGMSFGDTQCISNDPFVSLGIAATVTSHLRLGAIVTNPVTRHPALAACAIASVHAESGGRAVLGVGRGDSAVAQLGLPKATVGELAEYLRIVQGYLAGEEVEIEGHTSTLRWWDAQALPKVPVDVSATGPAVMAVGARLAERVTFNVGADPDRLRHSIRLARQARVDAGGSPDDLSLGAHVNLTPHRDERTSRELVKGLPAVYPRFSGMPGHPGDGMAPDDAALVRALDQQYDDERHARADADHVRLLTDDFIDRFGVVGSPEQCVEKLAGLVALGLDRILVVGPGKECPPELVAESKRLISDEVIPGLREAVAS